MVYDIKDFEELVEQGFLRKSEKDDLVLYGYTDECTYARHWTSLTRIARGLILDKNTGGVVAKSFPKFFNLNEMPETYLSNLPMHLAYESFEKIDGSLGIVFNHNGVWQIATRGSFYSDQAVKGAELLTKYNLRTIPAEWNLLVEIIYPDNKIVVDYGGKEELILLGGYNRETGSELHREIVDTIISTMTGMPLVESKQLTIEQMIALQKTLPKDQEGFVVRFENGLRCKVKGDEYVRIHKIISTLSPISFWECMSAGVVNKEYLIHIPEEYRIEFEPVVASLEALYQRVLGEIEQDLSRLPTQNYSPEDRKTIGLFLKTPNSIKHPGAIFSRILGQSANIEKYVMKKIRPDGNVMLE